MDLQKTTLVTSWFCPFAQRAYIALLRKGVKFEIKEQDPYDKSPEFLALNPLGLVPVIVDNGHSVYESAVCIEFVDENWNFEPRLLPTGAFDRARVRIWCDHITKKIVPQYYAILLKQTTEERNLASTKLLEALATLAAEMCSDSPFFLGDFGYVDIMLAPFAFRIDVILKHYRGFSIPAGQEDQRFTRYHTWWKAVRALDCVKLTCPPEEDQIAFCSKFADGSTTSLMAKTIKEN